jgi:plastocyanin
MDRRPAPRRARVLVVAVLASVLVACGGSGDGSSDGELRLLGKDNLQWDRTALSASAGTVTFVLSCEAGVNHNLVIEELDAQVAACAPGATATGTAELAAGTYTYVCTVPGHEVTMRGTLSVT